MDGQVGVGRWVLPEHVWGAFGPACTAPGKRDGKAERGAQVCRVPLGSCAGAGAVYWVFRGPRQVCGLVTAVYAWSGADERPRLHWCAPLPGPHAGHFHVTPSL